MECRLIYALVPKKDLIKIIETQANVKAFYSLSNIDHSMSMKDQKVTDSHNKFQQELMKQELLEHNIKSIWKEK